MLNIDADCDSPTVAPSFDGSAICESRSCFSVVDIRNGVCIYEARSCSHLPDFACMTSRCVNDSCAYVTADAGAACNDQDSCTVRDVCHANGSCRGTAVQCFSEEGECFEGFCDPLTGQCDRREASDGTPCSGGLCLHGMCIGSSTAACGNGIIDLGEVCDPAADTAGKDGVCCPNCRPVDSEVGECAQEEKVRSLHPDCFVAYCKRFEPGAGTCIVDVLSFLDLACGNDTRSRCDGHGNCL